MLGVLKIGKELKPLKHGQVFGRLTVLGKDEKRSEETKKPYYFCQCDCGSPVKSILKQSLVDKRKPTQSCGCIVKEKAGFDKDRQIALKKVLNLYYLCEIDNEIGDPKPRYFELVAQVYPYKIRIIE